jgi:hypothetical protein
LGVKDMLGVGVGLSQTNLLSFDLSVLFRTGEIGVIFDPSTTGTLYQTTAMILPANPGDPVGMMLDQSKWGGAALGSLYGDELVTNGGFATNIDGWSGARSNETLSLSSNTLLATATAAGAYGSVQALGSLVAGTYTVTADIATNASNSSAFLRVSIEASLNNTTTFSTGIGAGAQSTTVTATFTVTTAANYWIGSIGVATAGGATVRLDNISVREVTVANALAPIVGPELYDDGTATYSLGAGWTDSAGVLTFNNGTGTTASTSFSSVAGTSYLIGFEVVDVGGVNGSISLNGPGAVSSTFTTAGVKSVILTLPDNKASLSLSGVGGANFSIIRSSITIKEIPGYHATQATAAKRPTYGIHPFGGRRNLLTYSEDFSNAVWTKNSGAITTSLVAGPGGDVDATRITFTATAQLVQQNTGLTGTVTATGRIWIKGAVGEIIRLRLTSIGEVNVVLTGEWQEATGTATGNSNGGFAINTYGGATALVVDVWQPQLEQSATATAYQKVTSQYVVTETGVPSVHYLRFDGVDDAMATPSIDFSASDEMSVFAGVRKLSDAATAFVFELSASIGTNNGAVYVAAPFATGVGGYTFNSKGINQATASATSFTAPTTNILTGLGDISTDTSLLRVNGTQVATSATDQGTGNYGNYPLYIGARAGTSIYFNGNLYGLTVRGALSDDPTVAKAEKLVAKKTGISL